MKNRKYYKTADDVVCDVERRLNQVSFYFQFHNYMCNIIYIIYGHNKRKAFPVQMFTKLTSTARLKKMDSILYVYISWTIHGMWMNYIKFERGALERSPSAQPCSSVSLEQSGYYAAQDFFCT